MPVNDFKAFATGELANVLSQPEYEDLEALGTGFQSGIARSEELNKVWRQASTIASVVASFMATKSGNDVLDNGDLNSLQATLLKALLNNSTSQLDGRYLKATANLSELTNAGTARGNLGLKGAAVLDVGTAAATVAAGNDARIVNALQKGNNLADVTNSTAARSNLGLGTAATAAVQTSKDDTTPGRVLVNGSAIAIRAVKALAGGTGNDVSDTNSLPTNSASFVYSSALNAPGLTGTLLDVAGLNGSYNMQITAAYSGPGNIIKFRTYNGDAAKSWNPWYSLYHTGNKPTAADINAFPTSASTLNVNLNTLGNYASQGIYYQTTSANATAANNYPILEAGTLVVTPSAYGCQQEYTSFLKGRKFQRGLAGAWNGKDGPWLPWVEYFGTNLIPTAAQTGALPDTGGVVTGKVVFTENSNVINLRMKNAGNALYILASDSVNNSRWYVGNGGAGTDLSIHNYIAATQIIIGSVVSINKQLNVTGTINPTSYSNFDARYIRDVRLGTEASAVLGNPNPFRAPAGCTMTGWYTEGQNPGGDTIYYKPLQKNLNGTWVNFTG
jgi:hypothetical protein